MLRIPDTPIINGVSDHDAQLLIITTDYSLAPTQTPKTIRKLISTQYLTLLIN